MRGWRPALAILALGLALALAAGQAQAARLDDIRQRGVVTCGVAPRVAGFATIDAQGRYSGLDVDICRAVAAAIFGMANKVKFVEALTVKQFLASPEIDIVSRRLTWQLTREASQGLMFGPIVFYDGQGFLVPKSLGITGAKQLAGRAVCVLQGTSDEANLTAYQRTGGRDVKKALIQSVGEIGPALASGKCAAYSADQSELGSLRLTLPRPDKFAILPELISKEPLAPLVRQGDDPFFQIVQWSIFAMIDAEALGVTSRNVDAMRTSDDLDVKHLLGVIPGNGRALGLDEGWAAAIVKSVGNYGEMFDRDVGRDSPVKLDRGLNNLWTMGGLMYAPPVR